MRPDQRHILIILDGYGIAENPDVSAIHAAEKPYLDHLFATCPHGTLDASGLAVGLPEGQMGNSEVGHMNLGAGRVVYQDITRIDKAISDGEFGENEVLVAAARRAKENGTRLHLLGLFSDGGVHSHINHLVALLRLAASQGLAEDQVWIHAFTDGRDTDPQGGAAYVRLLEASMAEVGVGRIASVIGRYYAMDRDNRWERTKLAYDLLVHGEGASASEAAEALEASYKDGVTDEFVKPVALEGGARIQDGDEIVFYNFRADRARQLCRALADADFEGFDRRLLDINLSTFTPYDAEFDFPIAFPKVNLTRTLGQVIEERGGSQLRAAETEKYPHVTYFFSGGQEAPFEREARVLVPSPKVATYDMQPEMSAPELAERVAEALREHGPNLAILNFANPDMVGHTGVFEAAVKAVEAVDAGTRVVVEAALANGYGVSIIADHGNADRMQNPDGSPHTAHTTVPVPHLIIKPGVTGPIRHGKLGDVAPTILALLGEDQPAEMTGEVLI
ncbi:MAG: 2,3-bisphosphoglycerate-independent phosphoglycerate mutase [Rhodothermales bacterium]|nr:2,3-bisphosphoglycerate-independent phosphoglycerate mutase [Rhodothermales bacterium]MBO6780742.1 2,3-bisphosphoglycerate-independent phosphoglycerate mutase [Rhodothermales bacterium]